MSKAISKLLDFEIDKLINSIVNTLTGKIFETQIAKVTSKEVRFIKRTAWLFDWNLELRNPKKEVFKLTTVNNPKIIQGMMSFEDKSDHVFLHLLESAKFMQSVF